MDRSTRQRAAIRAALDSAGRPLLPQEIHDSARREVPGLGLATVYRTVKALVEDNVLRVVRLPGENARYEVVSGRHHHHHFQCTRCLRVFDVDACPGDLAHLAPPGFTVEEHEITLYGRCGACSAPPRRGRRTAR